MTLRTSLNELALFRRMKLAGCHCLTIPHHSSSKKESALRWLKWPSLYYISHIKLFIWCNLKPSQQNLRKFLIVLQHFGLRCSNNGLLKQKQEEYIFLPLWKDCLPGETGSFKTEQGTHYERRAMWFTCDFFKCFIKSWTWPRLFSPITKVMIIHWEAENNNTQREAERYKGSKIKGF